MIKHKVAMLGAFAVGKTSLVQRFVTGLFSDRYQTTIGVRIDQRQVRIDDRDVLMMLWDLQGEDDVHTVPLNHLRGSSGIFVVADGTRPETLDTALRLRREAFDLLGEVPSLLLMNKADLGEQWQIPDERLEELRAQGLVIVATSAKSGDHVADAFDQMAQAVIS